MIYRCCSNCKYWQPSGPSPPGVIQQMCTSEKSVNKGKLLGGGERCSQFMKVVYKTIERYNAMIDGMETVIIRD